MSFILDALKKSETERQRSTVPGISDLPVIVQQPRASAWIAVVIGALSIGVVVLGWAWWNASTPGESPASVRAPAIDSDPAPSRPVPQGPTRNLAAEARQIPRPSEPPPARTTQPGPVAVPSAVMTVGALRATGVAVPQLTLELHVYSNDPAQRFVFINSRKYVEGDVLQEGPRLLSITTEGAVLSLAGQNFLLPQE